MVLTVATTGEGVEALKEAVLNAACENGRGKRRKIVMGYGKDVEAAIKRVDGVIAKDANLSEKYPSRWLAIKALEHDDAVLKRMADSPYWNEIKELLPQQWQWQWQ